MFRRPGGSILGSLSAAVVCTLPIRQGSGATGQGGQHGKGDLDLSLLVEAFWEILSDGSQLAGIQMGTLYLYVLGDCGRLRLDEPFGRRADAEGGPIGCRIRPGSGSASTNTAC